VADVEGSTAALSVVAGASATGAATVSGATASLVDALAEASLAGDDGLHAATPSANTDAVIKIAQAFMLSPHPVAASLNGSIVTQK
jgi:hypothetical protein